MFISTTTLTSSPSDLTAVGQKQEACSSIGLLARQSPSDRPLTTPSSTTLSMAIRQPNWSEADTLFANIPYGCVGCTFKLLQCEVQRRRIGLVDGRVAGADDRAEEAVPAQVHHLAAQEGAGLVGDHALRPGPPGLQHVLDPGH